MVRKTIGILLASAALMTTAACNTVRGVSEDVKSVANTADKAI